MKQNWALATLVLAAGFLTGCGVSPAVHPLPTVATAPALPPEPAAMQAAAEHQPDASAQRFWTPGDAGSLYSLVGLVGPSETPLLPAKAPTAQP